MKVESTRSQTTLASPLYQSSERINNLRTCTWLPVNASTFLDPTKAAHPRAIKIGINVRSPLSFSRGLALLSVIRERPRSATRHNCVIQSDAPQQKKKRNPSQLCHTVRCPTAKEKAIASWSRLSLLPYKYFDVPGGTWHFRSLFQVQITLMCTFNRESK